MFNKITNLFNRKIDKNQSRELNNKGCAQLQQIVNLYDDGDDDGLGDMLYEYGNTCYHEGLLHSTKMSNRKIRKMVNNFINS